MKLVLKPRGRGNWNPLHLSLTGNLPPLLWRVGEIFTLKGINYRVCKVLP